VDISVEALRKSAHLQKANYSLTMIRDGVVVKLR